MNAAVLVALGILIALVGAIGFRVLAVGRRLVSNAEETMADLSKLQAQVAQNTSVEQSAVTLIQGLAQQIAAASGDQAAVDALASQLQTSASALAAAITANTPAAPPAATPPAAS